MSYPLKVAAFGLALVMVPGLMGCGDDGGGTSSSGTGGQNTGATGGETQGGAGGMGAGTATGATGGTGAGVAVTCDTGDYSNVVMGACDLLQQDCPTGNTCVPTDDGAGVQTTECVTANGVKPLGEICGNQNECQAGLFCVFDRCTPVCCDGENDQPCMGGACNLHLSLTQDTDDYMNVCTYLEPCEPLAANTCPDDQQCQIEQQGVMSCLPPSGNPALEGEPCEYNNDCGGQQACTQDDVCRWLCWTDNMGEAPGLGGCPPAQSCGGANTGIDKLGFCSPD